MCFVSAYAMKGMGVQSNKDLLGAPYIMCMQLQIMCVCSTFGLAVGVHMGEGGSSWAPGL